MPPGCPGFTGVVTVKAEAWSARRLPQNDTAGKKLGESNELKVHFDYSLTAAKFVRSFSGCCSHHFLTFPMLIF